MPFVTGALVEIDVNTKISFVDASSGQEKELSFIDANTFPQLERRLDALAALLEKGGKLYNLEERLKDLLFPMDYCLKITTGKLHHHSEGYLWVEIALSDQSILVEDGVKRYLQGEVVSSKCFREPIKYVSVKGSNVDGWEGSFEYTHKGVKKDLYCTDKCTKGVSANSVALDKDATFLDVTYPESYCVNANVCKLTISSW